jgi:hypothetical protein
VSSATLGGILEDAIDVAGLATGWAELIYAGCGGSNGDCLSKEEMLVMLLPATETESEDAYELCRALEAVEETDPCLAWYFDTGDLADAAAWNF